MHSVLINFIYNICALIARIPSGNLIIASFSKDAFFRATEKILKSCCENPIVNPTLSNLHAIKKIVIIGSPGAGKTTLARDLGPKLNINKVYHLDRLFWLRGWKAKARDIRIDILQECVMEKQWIIEGTYLKSSEPRLKAGDTIIFLDVPPLVCLQRIIKRHLASGGRSRRDLPMDCTDKLTLRRIFKVLTFPLHGRRMIKQTLRNYESKRIIWLRSGKEVEDFLARPEQYADDNKQYSNLELTPEPQLVL